jgi:predicted SAM-dependent methyltransferase
VFCHRFNQGEFDMAISENVESLFSVDDRELLESCIKNMKISHDIISPNGTLNISIPFLRFSNGKYLFSPCPDLPVKSDYVRYIRGINIPLGNGFDRIEYFFDNVKYTGDSVGEIVNAMITDKIKSDKDNTDEDIDLLMDQPVTLAKCNKLLETLGIGVSVYHIRKNRGYESSYRITIKFEDSILPLNTIYSLNAIGKNNNCGGVVFGLLIEVYSRINELLFDIESSPDLSIMSDDNLFNKFVYAKLLQRKIERCSLENLGTSLNERFLCNFITNVCSDIDREVSGLNGFISRIVLTGFGIFLTLKSSNGNGRIRNVLVYIPKGLKHNQINYTWLYRTLLRPSFFNDANEGAITTIIEKNKQIMLQNISSAEGNVKKWFDDIVTDIREKSIA